MIKKPSSNKTRQKRQGRIRNHVIGTASRPRLNVFRSANHIYAQVIDDGEGVTLASASTMEKDFKEYGGGKEAARIIGKRIAEKATALGVEEVVFDRAGYLYHGRVKELADGAREGGLKF